MQSLEPTSFSVSEDSLGSSPSHCSCEQHRLPDSSSHRLSQFCFSVLAHGEFSFSTRSEGSLHPLLEGTSKEAYSKFLSQLVAGDVPEAVEKAGLAYILENPVEEQEELLRAARNKAQGKTRERLERAVSFQEVRTRAAAELATKPAVIQLDSKQKLALKGMLRPVNPEFLKRHRMKIGDLRVRPDRLRAPPGR